eukprot:89157_1
MATLQAKRYSNILSILEHNKIKVFASRRNVQSIIFVTQCQIVFITNLLSERQTVNTQKSKTSIRTISATIHSHPVFHLQYEEVAPCILFQQSESRGTGHYLHSGVNT